MFNLKFKRGTTSQNDGYTGTSGEITIDTEKGTLRIHDGITPGGTELITTYDGRLDDSREWSAPTVSVNEAQGGVATNRRAWTSQRVRQAINAWWGTITLTKNSVGLNRVDNTNDLEKPISVLTQQALDGKMDVTGVGHLAAWATINGTGSLTVLDSHGISSVSQDGVGQYTFNLSSPMADNKYAIVTRSKGATNVVEGGLAHSVRTASSFQVANFNTSTTGFVHTPYLAVLVVGRR